jgi:hypothetical protein
MRLEKDYSERGKAPNISREFKRDEVPLQTNLPLNKGKGIKRIGFKIG